jgi:hypothetical protein
MKESLEMENQHRLNAETAFNNCSKKYEMAMDELKESIGFISTLRDQIENIEEELTELKESKELYTQVELFSKTVMENS